METTGGPAAVRQVVLDLAGRLDEAWEPLGDLLETTQAARDLLGGLRDELLDRVERAERAAEQAAAATQEALAARDAAETTRDEALRQARDARDERDRALRAEQDAVDARQAALQTQQRLAAERDAAREQADRAAAAADEAVAAATTSADARVREAVEAATKAREAAASLRGELAATREQVNEETGRNRVLGEEVERIRTRSAEQLASEIARITADADKRVERAHAEIDSLRRAEESRLREDAQRLGAQTERADRLERECAGYEATLGRILTLLSDAEHQAVGDRSRPDPIRETIAVILAERPRRSPPSTHP
ncbi:coiled-coil domain-containing protein [Saccharothrix hoggarensis]|uniref:Chromosome partition protein Smc n=1 Tax=Saccharothrix hoggarensis TaxID=913853 RepID=A0ABW3QHC1_9PSEU